MELFRVQPVNIRKVLPILLGIVVLVVLGYYLPKVWKLKPEFFRQMPAALQKPVTEEKKPEEKLELKEISLEEGKAPEKEKEKEAPKVGYLEVAGKGEGITHLARRALKRYLQANPQNFQVTPEHKIYIEDYLAKSLGGRWLKLGEEIGFSEDLIKAGIEAAQKLTPNQLQNLVQYSQLVSGLNY